MRSGFNKKQQTSVLQGAGIAADHWELYQTCLLLLMAEILHQLIGSFSHYL